MKIFAIVILMIASGIGVAYAVNHVGDLNQKANIIEACLQENPGAQSQSCPDRPLSEAQVKNLRSTANTFGTLGWIAFFFLVFGIGGSVFDFLN